MIETIKSQLTGVQTLYQAGRLAEAEAVCREILTQMPQQVETLAWLGLLADRQGRPDEGIAYYQQVLTLKPEMAEMHSNLASVLSRQGKHEAAIAEQREALRLSGDRADIHYNLAVILAEAGDLEQAQVHYKKSLELDPTSINTYNNLGTLLGNQGNLEESLVYYQKAVELAPNHFNAQNNLAVTLSKLDRLEEAIPHYERAIALQPSAISHHNLGYLYQRQGKGKEARGHFEQAIAIDPDYFSAHSNLAIVLQQQGKLEDALTHYRKALELKPDAHWIYDNMGTAFHEQKKLEEAIASYHKSIELNPKHANAYSNLATALIEQGNYEEAIAACHEALQLNPNHADAHNNLASAYLELARFEEAVTEFETTIAIKPEHTNAHLNLGITLLLLGQYERGWQEYHWRWQTKQCPDLRYPQALWDGSDLEGKRILLTAEQGLGDTIQFVRYASLVAQKGGRVIVACQKPLMRLFSSLKGIERCVDRDRTDVETQYHIPLLDLPMVLGTRVETIPAPIPYLAPLPTSKVELKEFPGVRLKVGFVWGANPGSNTAKKRSTELARFLKLLDKVPEIALYSLQKEPSEADKELLAEEHDRFQDLRDQLNDFSDTATAIAQLDLVISVDTSVIHLAGALGRPVWTLLSFVADWRWLWKREDTAWYPTMRLFRQSAAGDWEAVFQRVTMALQVELSQPEPLQRYRLAQPEQSEDPIRTHLRLGYSYYRQGQLPEAIAQYEHVLSLQPDLAEAHSNLGAALCQQGQAEEAIAHYRTAIRLQPDSADAHLNLGLALLSLGDLTQGFSEYFWRWRTEGHALPYPETLWNGGDLTGKAILLTAEQGYGDTIQFIRYAPLVAARGGEVVVACQKNLVRLLSTAAGVSRCIDRDTESAQVHCHAPLLELPRILGTTLETIPAEVPYLAAPYPAFLDAILADLPAKTLKVGIVWASQSTSLTAQSRSCRLGYWQPLFALPDIAWFSLQHKPSEAEKAYLAEQGIHDCHADLHDFADTAAAIAQMDLVISVDTAVAHLAGALGKLTWTLLPFAADWRWLRDRADNPWYPTMRLFRQTPTGIWAEVIEQVQQALPQAVLAKASAPIPQRIVNAPPAPLLPTTNFNQLKACRHGAFLYNRHDVYIGRSLELYGEWSEGEVDVFRVVLRPGDVVVEVGANIGTHTVFFANAVTETGKVLAYEPQRIVFQTLCANIALNSLVNVHCYPVGLGEAAGFAQIPALDYRQPNNFGGVSLRDDIPGEQVQVTTLDSFALSQCRLLKIDAEGMELQVLKGASETLKRCQPILYIENDRPDKATALVQHLHQLGYQMYWHKPLIYNPDNFCHNSHNVFGRIASINMLCVLPEHQVAVAGMEPVLKT